MKVLALPRYGRLGASSRVRFFQYLPALERAGFEVSVEPLFSDAYVAGLQRLRRSKGEVVRAYARRIAGLLRKRRFDVLWVEKELLPWVPLGLERHLLASDAPLVLDYDDAVFHYYDQHRSGAVRRLLAGKHPGLMRRAVLVVAGNDYIAEFARAVGARAVAVLPTAVELGRYGPVERVATDGPPRIGWIGQRSTAEYLRHLSPLFERLSAGGKARFVAIGIEPAALGLPMEGAPWSEATEVASLRALDVGVMPLADSPFERGKCGYKLVQYMACGLPVVASPVGVNAQLIDDGVNGFLATSPAEWESALERLIGDASLRDRMGRAGRMKVEESYSTRATAPRLVELLHEAARTRAKGGEALCAGS